MVSSSPGFFRAAGNVATLRLSRDESSVKLKLSPLQRAPRLCLIPPRPTACKCIFDKKTWAEFVFGPGLFLDRILIAKRREKLPRGVSILIELQAKFQLTDRLVGCPDSFHAVAAKVMSRMFHVLFGAAQCSERFADLRMRFCRSRCRRSWLCSFRR
jgi:hypothetical protein